MTDIKLRNTNRELINRNIGNTVLKMEMLSYKREIVILLNMFFRLKSKYIIKGAIAQIEKKQGKPTCVSIPSENSNIKKTKIKQKQNFSGETSFFQHNLNSGCKHITDNKLHYRGCHLSCIRSFHRLSIHFENHIHHRCF